MKISVFVLIAALTLLAGSAVMAANLQNGNFDSGVWTTIATNWTGYSIAGAMTYTKQTTTFKSAPNSQAIKTATTAGSEGGIMQTIDAGIGDAFTFYANAYPLSASSYTRLGLGVKWDGTTTTPPIWLVDPLGTSWFPTRNAWNILKGSGNATTTSVTMFLDVKRGTSNGDTTTYWDDIFACRAYVPEKPIVSAPTANSLNVNVDPGGNSTNANAEFAVTIGGGAYVLGTDWLQQDGSVSAYPVWLTDGLWGDLNVAGLAAGTAYTFQAKGRYDGNNLLETYLGADGVGATTTIPEPGSMIVLMSGLVGLVGFGIRRRK